MRPRTVLVLLILVAGLIAFIELYEGELPSSDERSQLDRRVLKVDRDEVVTVELAGEVNRVRLHRGDSRGSASGWRLEEPLEAPADDEQVEALIDSLVELEMQRTLEDVQRSEAGLDPARLIVTLSTGERQERLYVGAEIPAGDSMIVGRDGVSEVYVVDDRLWDELSREPGDWRRRSVFGGARDEIERVAIRRSDGAIALTDRNGNFWLESPIIDRADADRVDKLLAAIVSLRVEQFVDEPLDAARRLAMGLEETAPRLEVELRETEEPFRLAWGAPVPDGGVRHYAEASGLVFETASTLGELLEVEPEVWRSPTLTSLKTFQVDEIELEQPGDEPILLVRSGADWLRNAAKISFPIVSDLIYAIADLSAEGFLSEVEDDSSEIDSSPPALKVILRGAERREVLTFRDLRDGEMLARVSDRDIGLLVEENEFTELLDTLTAVRAAEPLNDLEDEQQRNPREPITFDQ